MIRSSYFDPRCDFSCIVNIFEWGVGRHCLPEAVRMSPVFLSPVDMRSPGAESHYGWCDGQDKYPVAPLA